MWRINLAFNSLLIRQNKLCNRGNREWKQNTFSMSRDVHTNYIESTQREQYIPLLDYCTWNGFTAPETMAFHTYTLFLWYNPSWTRLQGKAYHMGDTISIPWKCSESVPHERKRKSISCARRCHRTVEPAESFLDFVLEHNEWTTSALFQLCAHQSTHPGFFSRSDWHESHSLSMCTHMTYNRVTIFVSCHQRIAWIAISCPPFDQDNVIAWYYLSSVHDSQERMDEFSIHVRLFT